MRVGTAYRDITPEGSLALLGQMAVRMATHTRDPLTVNAVAFVDADRQSAVVSVDVCMMPADLVARLKAACTEWCGIDPARIMIAATHTHVAPCTTNALYGEADPEWLDRLARLTGEAVADAFADAEEVDMFSGTGWLDYMGWNRRGLRADGACHMYYGSWAPDHVGIEGPRDGEVPVLFARRKDGTLKAVVSSFSTHPNCVEGEHFYSADIPGEVRRVVRAVHGPDVGFAYLTGAAGDTAPSIMEDNPEAIQPWRGESGLKRSGEYLGGEILRVIASAVDPMIEPVLAHESRTIDIPVREWDEAVPITEFGGGMFEFFDDSKRNWDTFRAEHPAFPVTIHTLRVGDAAICTNPAELYCAFGLAIKELSPAQTTLVSELADGWCGYVPTPHAIKHGGYSAQASNVNWLDADAGRQIVITTREMLGDVFTES